jgi:hypothetical protein
VRSACDRSEDLTCKGHVPLILVVPAFNYALTILIFSWINDDQCCDPFKMMGPKGDFEWISCCIKKGIW